VGGNRREQADTGGRSAAAVLRERLGTLEPEIAIVLGSGLGGLADVVQDGVAVPYRDLPGVPAPTVAGHTGEFLAGRLEGRDVILQRGRLHLYEGHDPQTVAIPVRLMAELGVPRLLLTNAAGGINPAFRPPALMVITDHLNLTGCSPLAGPVLPGETRFPDMTEAYDPGLRALAHRAADAAGVTLHDGVYAGLLGPSYETPAEIRYLARIGADAVGMSTVLEAIVARARGMLVLGISTITNPAAGTAPEPLNHEEVLAAGKAVAKDLEAVVRGVVKDM